LNDDIIRSFSNENVDNLINMLLESVKLYPREYLFINTDGKLYSEKGLQKMLYDLLPDKNIGVNALRSIYASYWLPKLNKNQITRIAFLMRSSVSMLSTNYLKKNNDSRPITTQPEQIRADVEQEKKETKKPRDRREYLKNYYEQNKEKIIDFIKENDKKKYNNRFVRELNDGVITWDKVRKSTREKYKLEFDEKNNKYISKL
jgi:hypothetical protein